MMNFQFEKFIEVISQTPVTLRSMLENLSDDWTQSAENHEDWSPFDVVGHLIHADETNWIPRVEAILAQGADLKFPPFDRFGQFEKTGGKNLFELLADFAAVRTEKISLLQSLNLTEEKLNLEGTHPEFGAVKLKQLLATWAVHDLTHIKQIVTFMARRYSEDVGPWKSYLSILQNGK